MTDPTTGSSCLDTPPVPVSGYAAASLAELLRLCDEFLRTASPAVRRTARLLRARSPALVTDGVAGAASPRPGDTRRNERGSSLISRLVREVREVRSLPAVGDAEVDCPGGRLAVRAAGAPGGPVVVCVPGLSANLRSFDRLVGALTRSQRLVIAVDLRGRGRSQITPPGTYGWPAHVADVLAVADYFGAASFEWIGHSMGAFLGLVAASRHPDRVRRLVLIDAAGRPEPSALGSIARSIARLGSVHPSAEAYLQWVRANTSIEPWDPMWEALLQPRTGTRCRRDAGEDRRDSHR